MSQIFSKRLVLIAGCFITFVLAGFLMMNEPVSYAELAYTESSYVLGEDAGSVIPASCESGYEHTAGECADVWWCDAQSGLGDAWCTNQCCTMSSGAVQCGTNGGTNTSDTTSVTDDNAIANGWCTTDTTTVTNSCGIGGGTSSYTQCSCDAGYTMSGGVCVSCVSTSPGTYTDPDGTPNGWCTNNWTNNFNSCTGVNTISDLSTVCSCDAGYTMSGGVCQPNACVPVITTSPGTYTDPDGTPNGWCTNNWTNNFNSCTGVNTISDLSTVCSCDAGYTMSGGVCVSNAVSVNGSCSATAETCTTGVYSNSPADTATYYQWTCNGSGTPVGTNSPTCTAPKTVVYSCTGSIPANAGAYDAEESSSLTADTVWSYSGLDTVTKCQYSCTTGTWDGSSCVVAAGTCSGTQDRTVTGSVSGGTVWGSDIYTDDSEVGMAAVHFGLLSPGQTATIRKTFIGDQPSFTGTTRNGVTTANWNSSWCAMTLSLVSASASAVGNISATTCQIPSNASTCVTNVTWSTTDASSVSVQTSTTTISSGKPNNVSGLSRSVSYGKTMFSLYSVDKLLDAEQVIVDCAANNSWVGGVCVSTVTPPTLTVSKSPVVIGNSITLSWDTNNGDETSCSLNGKGVSNATLVAGGGDTNETGSVNVTISGRTTFTLTCNGLSAIKTVEVIPTSWES